MNATAVPHSVLLISHSVGAAFLYKKPVNLDMATMIETLIYNRRKASLKTQQYLVLPGVLN